MFFKMPSCLLAGSILSQLLSTQAYAEEPPFIVDEEFQSIDETEKFKLEHPDSATTEQIDKSPSYTIKHVSFRGGSVFELSEISKLVNPLIGKAVKPGDLRSVLNSINIKYRDAGYPLSYAYLPKQDLSSGRLEIYLIEGYIGRSEILIEDQDIQHRVHTLIEKIKNQRPLKTATFDRAIALIESTQAIDFASAHQNQKQ
ncbi:hypothetical protein A8C75_19830 [Marinobacterium aestuarii]|uniref:Polypeptide-transport-associated ShlB-type domain-containing protein n=1 Tax=Marinobacterium aestuarii TaxID=1821621 RepID=A0A1A9F411_9GAMM|nr:POTRA domain-containing protein [Marinobacterium aestuarii]ANG64499.1 hypothetical protein A8C75_19830 [Marinobacterium aestuarii]